jgi:hypothetical protein
MKIFQYLLLVILVLPLLSACGAASQATATPFAESMKGYELYSWQEDGQWNFAVLVGTNREKTLEEIKAEETVLHGLDALTAALEQMPAGQYITWSSRETLSFPPQDIIEQIEKICADRGLLLSRVA